MQDIFLSSFLMIVAVSLLSAAVAYWALAHTQIGAQKSIHSMVIESEAQAAFLFDDDMLVDATDSARDLLVKKIGDISDWDRFIASLAPRFSTLSDDLQHLADIGSLTILPDSLNDDSVIEAEWWDGLARLVVVNNATNAEDLGALNLETLAMEYELDTLRPTAQLAPYLVWKEDDAGKIQWANSAYLSLTKSLGANNSWPPTPLFNQLDEVVNGAGQASLRVSITGARSGEVLWFDLTRKKVNDGLLCFAIPADAVVKAEASLKGFVQTLTQTFAHLSIGLAVFDKNRQLALFNPALTDLTRLPVDFLSARPSMFDLLDRLRDNKMVPEPRDYKSWRQQMLALEEDSVDGTYEEIWALPSGQTYHVTGRPHPDGAVALLFEDISAEVSLTRNFRQELEVGQSVMDAIPDAMVVFSSSGIITMSNVAYTKLWGVDPSTAFGEMSINDATQCWQKTCDPTPLWENLRTFIHQQYERVEWFGDATLDDGRTLVCQFTPLKGGSTMAKFHVSGVSAKQFRSSRAGHSPPD